MQTIICRNREELKHVLDQMEIVGFKPIDWERDKMAKDAFRAGSDLSKEKVLITFENGWIIGDNVSYTGFENKINYKDWASGKRNFGEHPLIEDKDFKIGDRAEVIDAGKNYTIYSDAFRDIGFNYTDGHPCNVGDNGIIFHICSHSLDKSKVLLAINLDNGKQCLIDKDGVKKIDWWSNLKKGDCVVCINPLGANNSFIKDYIYELAIDDFQGVSAIKYGCRKSGGWCGENHERFRKATPEEADKYIRNEREPLHIHATPSGASKEIHLTPGKWYTLTDSFGKVWYIKFKEVVDVRDVVLSSCHIDPNGVYHEKSANFGRIGVYNFEDVSSKHETIQRALPDGHVDKIDDCGGVKATSEEALLDEARRKFGNLSVGTQIDGVNYKGVICKSDYKLKISDNGEIWIDNKYTDSLHIDVYFDGEWDKVVSVPESKKITNIKVTKEGFRGIRPNYMIFDDLGFDISDIPVRKKGKKKVELETFPTTKIVELKVKK